MSAPSSPPPPPPHSASGLVKREEKLRKPVKVYLICKDRDSIANCISDLHKIVVEVNKPDSVSAIDRIQAIKALLVKHEADRKRV
jgi:hypothetical protein